MTRIEITVKGAMAKLKQTGILTSGMRGVEVLFRFDSEWDGLERTAVFKGSGVVRDQPLIQADQTTVPPETLHMAGEPLKIGIEGRSSGGEVVIPSIWCQTGTVYSGASASGDPSFDPGPSVYDDVIERVNGILRTNIEDAVEKHLTEHPPEQGRPGPMGPMGPAGPAGPQGPAYELTEEDKAELVGDVLQELTGGIALKDRQTGTDYAIYMRGGALMIEERTARAGTAESMTMTDRTTGSNYRIYVEAGNLIMEELGE